MRNKEPPRQHRAISDPCAPSDGALAHSQDLTDCLDEMGRKGGIKTLEPWWHRPVILALGGRRSRVQAFLEVQGQPGTQETLSRKHEDRCGRACLRSSVLERLCQKDHFEGVLSYIVRAHL